MKAGRRAAKGHELLQPAARKGKEEFSHGFSASEMRSLAAMCEAFIPSIAADVGAGNSLRFFLSASGAEFPVPDEVAELVAKRSPPEAAVLVKAVLWLLSTRLGTLLLCGGSAAFTGAFPYLTDFAGMSVERREQVLQGWNRRRIFFPLRVVFVVIKILSNFILYSLVDKNGENHAWNALGYSLPAHTAEPPAAVSSSRPLDSGIVEAPLHQDDDALLQALRLKGLDPSITGDGHILVRCDAVVVGSGCGGGVAAAVLANAGHKVVVIEKGNYFTSKDYTSVELPSLRQLYESGGIFSSIDMNMMVLAGSTVGGGSAVNWSATFRTPDNVLKEWAVDHRLPFFGGTTYSAAMDAVCERLGVTTACREEGFQNKILRRGGERLGLRVDPIPRNSSEGHFCGFCLYGCPTGEKRGSDTTWLVDAVKAGAVIISGCKAERFVFSGAADGRKKRKCIGVIANMAAGGLVGTGRRLLRIEAKVSVAACGALLTPPLLLASGLKNRNIGNNLRLHPVALAWGHFPSDPASPDEAVYEGGIMTSIHHVKEGVIIETPVLGPSTAAAMFPWLSGEHMKQSMLKYRRRAYLFVLVRDAGAGTVKSEGRITYRLSSADIENLTTGLRTALRILAAAGAEEVGTHRSDGQHLNLTTCKADDFEKFLNGIGVAGGAMAGQEHWSMCSTAHQMGSCRMAANKEAGAVDAAGEAWEAEGLFVCDGSVLPTAIGVNPMLTIMSTAYCIAKGIVGSSYLK